MSRFPAGVGIINASLKCGKTYCEIPSNKLLANTLRLLRNYGYIWGFSYVTPQKRYAKLYPRVRVFLKYVDLSRSIIKNLAVFKRTKSNYYVIKQRQLSSLVSQHQLRVITTSEGLKMTTLDQYYSEKVKKIKFGGKYLLEIFK